MEGDELGIWVIADVEAWQASPFTTGSHPGGGLGPGAGQDAKEGFTKRIRVSAGDLKRQIGELLSGLGDVFSQPSGESRLMLDAVDLSVEISSEGQVSILGTGNKYAGKGGMRLTLKHRPTAQ
jgi:hypothetical protein